MFNIEDTIKKHIELRSRMFSYSKKTDNYNITRKLEELITEIYKCLLCEGDVVIDVGAHTGYHSRIFSDIVGETGIVFAYEPNKELKEKFDSHIGNRDNIKLVHKVLSDTRKQTLFNFVKGKKSSRSSLILWDEELQDDEIKREKVTTTTIDLHFHLSFTFFPVDIVYSIIDAKFSLSFSAAYIKGKLESKFQSFTT